MFFRQYSLVDYLRNFHLLMHYQLGIQHIVHSL